MQSSFSRNLAAELGVDGVRVVNIRSGGSPDSAVFADAIRQRPEAMKSVLPGMEGDTMLKTLPLMADIANSAVFLASDLAAKITAIQNALLVHAMDAAELEDDATALEVSVSDGPLHLMCVATRRYAMSRCGATPPIASQSRTHARS